MTRSRWTDLTVVGLVLAALLACKKQEKPAGASAESPPATTGAAPAAPLNAADLSGSYKILSASNPGGGGSYTGTVAIAKNGDLFSIGWTISGTPPYKGVGIVDGQTFGIGWGLGKAYGVAVYKVDGGKLDGKWATSMSKGHAGTEKLDGPAGLNGTYKITEGKDGDSGDAYTGTVSIAPAGTVYNVTWKLAKESYSGVGILEGNVFTVGWGTAGAGAGVVVYSVGDKLDGKWAQPGGKALGSEVLGKS